MSSSIKLDLWDRALDSIARETRNVRRQGGIRWKLRGCDPRPPPRRRAFPEFRILGHLAIPHFTADQYRRHPSMLDHLLGYLSRGVWPRAAFYAIDGPGPPPDVSTVPCPCCRAPIQLWPLEEPSAQANGDDASPTIVRD